MEDVKSVAEIYKDQLKVEAHPFQCRSLTTSSIQRQHLSVYTTLHNYYAQFVWKQW